MTTLTQPPQLDSTAPEFGYCAEVTRTRARNFYFGLRLAPEPRRSALYALYAWSRLGDDIADAEPHADTSAPSRRQQLARFRERTEHVIRTRQAPDDGGDERPIWAALAVTLDHYPIDGAWLLELIEGLEFDAVSQNHSPTSGCDSRESLDLYCYRVASTVGLMCVSVWGPRAGVPFDRLRAPAIARGKAFQLTNILRDFAEDFDAEPRRIYIPPQDFADAGTTPEALRDWTDPEAAERLVAIVARRARTYYESSAVLESLIDPACRPVLSAMTGIYRTLLDRIEAEPRRVIASPRVSLSGASKIIIAGRALLDRSVARLSGRG